MSVFSSEWLLKAGELGLLLTPELDRSYFENRIFNIAFYPDFSLNSSCWCLVGFLLQIYLIKIRILGTIKGIQDQSTDSSKFVLQFTPISFFSYELNAPLKAELWKAFPWKNLIEKCNWRRCISVAIGTGCQLTEVFSEKDLKILLQTWGYHDHKTHFSQIFTNKIFYKY